MDDMKNFIKKSVTKTGLVIAVLASTLGVAAGTAQAAESCWEYDPYSVSTGMMVGGKYTTAAICLKQRVSSGKVLTIDGYSTDDAGDGICTVAVIEYTRSGDSRAKTIKYAPNCGGKVAFPKRSIENLTSAKMSLCLYTQATGSEKCVNTNAFYPEPTRKKNPFGPR